MKGQSGLLGVIACVRHPSSSIVRHGPFSRSNCVRQYVFGRILNGLSSQSLSCVGREVVDRTTHARNDRAMAATALECSNTWGIVNSLRRVFIHRFPVVNAIAGVMPRLQTAGLAGGQ
jgi:hypothetical protein